VFLHGSYYGGHYVPHRHYRHHRGGSHFGVGLGWSF
jgi:hypothetical protein